MIKPITDRIFIRLAPEKETTEGGIIIVDDYHKNRNIGIVEEIGPLVSSVKKAIKCCSTLLTSFLHTILMLWLLKKIQF